MSTSNTLTKNDLKKVLEKISIGSGGVIDADDMTQAEIDNFLEDINAQGKPSEYRKLLWTNPSPNVAFAAQTISLDLSDYDEVELFIAGNCATHNTSTQSFKLTVGKGGLLNISANVIWWRYVTPTINGVEFGTGYQTATYGANGTTNNEFMVPYKIYGIKYERVAPPQVEYPNYSTEEQVIGTFIDGKTIYRKSKIYIFDGNAVYDNTFFANISVDNIVSQKVQVMSGTTYAQQGFYWSASDYFRCWITLTNNPPTVSFNGATPSGTLVGAKILITIDYTKV